MEPKELSFEESMKQVMKTLPPLIRDYLVQEKYTPVARSLMTKYALRIDQGGVLEREIMLLLMGVENPTEFTTALAEEAKLTKIVIDGIVQDVNNLIFVPLRKEEEKSGMGGNVQAPVKPVVPIAAPIFAATPFVAPPRPAAPAVVAAPRPVVASDAGAPRPAVATPQPVVAAPHIAPLPPKTVMPVRSAATLGDVMRSILPTPVSEPRAAKSINLLEDHEEPSPSLKAMEAVAPVAFTKPVMPVAPAVPLAPINLPGAMPSYTIPTIPTKVIPGPRPAVVVAPQIPTVESLPEPMMPKPVFVPPKPVEPAAAPAPVAPYSSDPYREPVDEPVDEM